MAARSMAVEQTVGEVWLQEQSRERPGINIGLFVFELKH
jgi:hypothetical protein